MHNFWLQPHAEFSIAVVICSFVVLKAFCQQLSIVVGIGWEWTGCVPKYLLICPKIGVWLSVLCCISCLPPSQQGLQQCICWVCPNIGWVSPPCKLLWPEARSFCLCPQNWRSLRKPNLQWWFGACSECWLWQWLWEMRKEAKCAMKLWQKSLLVREGRFHSMRD